jgi:hypothetical protein
MSASEKSRQKARRASRSRLPGHHAFNRSSVSRMTTALPNFRSLRPLAQNGQSIAATTSKEAAHRRRI